MINNNALFRNFKELFIRKDSVLTKEKTFLNCIDSVDDVIINDDMRFIKFIKETKDKDMKYNIEIIVTFRKRNLMDEFLAFNVTTEEFREYIDEYDLINVNMYVYISDGVWWLKFDVNDAIDWE